MKFSKSKEFTYGESFVSDREPLVTALRLVTTRLITNCQQRHVDVVQIVCPALVPVHAVWRLTDPDSFFDLSILPVNYFCSSQWMTWLASAIWPVAAHRTWATSSGLCSPAVISQVVSIPIPVTSWGLMIKRILCINVIFYPDEPIQWLTFSYFIIKDMWFVLMRTTL